MRSIKYIPQSHNFSEFSDNVPAEHEDDKVLEYEASDGGQQMEACFSKIQGDELLFNLLSGLDNRDKVVLLYQLLKESGYDLQQDECARTLSISKTRYVILVKEVRRKCMKILRGSKSKI